MGRGGLALTLGRRHPLWQQPGLGMPLFAMTLAVLMLAIVVVQKHSDKPALMLGTSSVGGSQQVVVEVRGMDDFRVGGEPVSTLTDLQFRLSGKSPGSSQLTLTYAPGLSAAQLNEVLEACSRAGFGRVVLSDGAPPATPVGMK